MAANDSKTPIPADVRKLMDSGLRQRYAVSAAELPKGKGGKAK